MWLSELSLIPLLVLSLACAPPATGPAGSTELEPSEKGFRRWYVYSDAAPQKGTVNHAIPDGFMPKEAAEMIKLSMVDKTRPFAGETCIKIDIVDWKEPYWAGVAWLSQAKGWGEKPGQLAYDLRGARKLVFYARTAKPGAKIEVKCAIAGPREKPYGDSAMEPAESGWITLETEWKRYEILLDDKMDLERVITPFVWSSNAEACEGEPVTIFFDQIFYLIPERKEE